MNRKELLRLADTYGCPLYVYDTDVIINQYKKITKAFSKVKNVKINYATKALSNINILKVFNSFLIFTNNSKIVFKWYILKVASAAHETGKCINTE